MKYVGLENKIHQKNFLLCTLQLVKRDREFNFHSCDGLGWSSKHPRTDQGAKPNLHQPPVTDRLGRRNCGRRKDLSEEKKSILLENHQNFLWFIMHIKVFLNTPRKQVFFCNYLKKYFCLSKMLLNFQHKKCFKSIITWVKIFCIKSFYSSSSNVMLTITFKNRF